MSVVVLRTMGLQAWCWFCVSLGLIFFNSERSHAQQLARCGSDLSTIFLVTPCYVNGDPLLGGDAGEAEVLAALPYVPSTNGSAENEYLAIGSQIGSTWGIAHQQSSKTIFAGAVLKRHVGLGSAGTGGLYLIDASVLESLPVPSPPASPTVFNLASLGVDTGPIPVNRNLPGDKNNPSHDSTAWDAAGKISLGDVDISEDERTLWIMNLYERTIVELDISNLGAITLKEEHLVPDPGCLNSNGASPVAAPDDYRPWGLKDIRDCFTLA